ncbi:MAG: hypothetical protein J0L79_01710 [Rickettsiales bacterium]|nr:hypothetical protein [Rickettsiales bacterium]
MSKAEVEDSSHSKKKLTEVILELSKQLTEGTEGVSTEQLQKIIDGLGSSKSNIAEVIAYQEGVHKYVVKSAIMLADKKVKSKTEETELSSNTDKDQKDQVELAGGEAETGENQ